jgi:hypothetical protein
MFRQLLLDLSYFDGRHTATNISDQCLSVVDDFSLRDKVLYVVTDNAANMLKAFKLNSELFHEIREDGLASFSDTSLPPVHDEDELSTESENSFDEAISADGEEPLDNADIDTVMQSLGSITRRRLSCAIHSLQLVVLDGLKCAKFMSLILSKISRLATLIHTSVNFSENFFKIFNHTVPTTVPQTHVGIVCTSSSVQLRNLIR